MEQLDPRRLRYAKNDPIATGIWCKTYERLYEERTTKKCPRPFCNLNRRRHTLRGVENFKYGEPAEYREGMNEDKRTLSLTAWDRAIYSRRQQN